MSSNISFSQNLQSESGQMAINSLLDTELKVLEILKKFLSLQIRLEKDMTVTLGNAAATALKGITSILTDGISSPKVSTANRQGTASRKSTLTHSVISKETMHVITEVETTINGLKRNINFLEDNTLRDLNELISQKKILQKATQDEYEKIKGNLDQCGEIIRKRKEEYFKQFQAYETSRTKFEEICAKGRAENPKKSEDLRDKFFRMKKRLDLCHTEYLLVIQDGKMYDRDFRTILLPSLLQIEQSWSEKQLTQWNQILDEILQNNPGISAAARLRLKEIDFSKTFMDLISKHKSPALIPMDFKFEPARVSSQPSVQPNLIIDANTLDLLRQKMGEIEKRLKTLESQLSDKESEAGKYKGKEIAASSATVSLYSNGKLPLIEELKTFEISASKCDIDRLRHFKTYIEAYLIPRTSNPNIEMTSLGSETSLKKRARENRFSTFFRNATSTLKRKSHFGSYEPEANVETLPKSPLTPTSAKFGLRTSNNDATLLVVKKDLTLGIADEDWFHGVLPREDVVRLLSVEGDYLIRLTSKNGEHVLVLSVLWNGFKHFMIQITPSGGFKFEGPTFPTVKQLLDHYRSKGEAITNRSSVIIVQAVAREKWELNNDDVQLIEKIGKGNFGDVFKASFTGTLVAVKTCKTDLPEEQRRKFLQEGRILKQYNHPNIVQFIGLCVQKQPIMIVMELVPGGSLLTFLKGQKGKSLSTKDLTSICLSTASGMKYLEDKNCLHRDLAARNCLIIDDSSCRIKISDFGMSRQEHEYTVSDGLKQIPIKWTAPEALNYGRYTTLSDVWSYGILVWEVFSYGATPYPGMSNAKSREMVEVGYRMPVPDGMPDLIYQLMARCWQYEPEQRPRFAEIYSELELMAMSDLI